MVVEDPTARPSAAEVVEAVVKVEAALSREQLRLSARKEPDIPGVTSSVFSRMKEATKTRRLALLEEERKRNGGIPGAVRLQAALDALSNNAAHTTSRSIDANSSKSLGADTSLLKIAGSMISSTNTMHVYMSLLVGFVVGATLGKRVGASL